MCMFTMSSFVKRTQKSYLNKNKDILLKYDFGKSESNPYENHQSKSLKVSDIKCILVSKVEAKMRNDVFTCMNIAYTMSGLITQLSNYWI